MHISEKNVNTEIGTKYMQNEKVNHCKERLKYFVWYLNMSLYNSLQLLQVKEVFSKATDGH